MINPHDATSLKYLKISKTDNHVLWMQNLSPPLSPIISELALAPLFCCVSKRFQHSIRGTKVLPYIFKQIAPTAVAKSRTRRRPSPTAYGLPPQAPHIQHTQHNNPPTTSSTNNNNVDDKLLPPPPPSFTDVATDLHFLPFTSVKQTSLIQLATLTSWITCEGMSPLCNVTLSRRPTSWPQ